LALVVVAQQIVMFDLIPVSNSKLWIDKFVAWSFYWVLLGLVESVLIGFLWYLREDRAVKEEEKRVTSDPDERVSLMNQSGGEDGGNAVTNTIKNDGAVAIDSLSDDEVPMTRNDRHETVPKVASKEAKMEREKSDDNCLQFWFYNYSLKRIDLICLLLAVLSYTGFIAFMFISVHQEKSIWSDNEPTWFTSDTQFSVNAYELGNPDA